MKLFIDHKVLYFDIKDYEFFVLTSSADGVFLGYFSRIRNLKSPNNLSCIVVLPPYQSKGYGTFLIELSYELSKKEGRVCSPETPLSEMGRILYHSYWKRKILEVFNYEMLAARCKNKRKNVESIKEISQLTTIVEQDILTALKTLGLVFWYKKDWSLVEDRSVINRTVRQQYKPVTKCPFDESLLNI